jgi:hypothetical protein
LFVVVEKNWTCKANINRYGPDKQIFLSDAEFRLSVADKFVTYSNGACARVLLESHKIRSRREDTSIGINPWQLD